MFIVTVEPKPNVHKVYKNTHPGQEFNMVLEGTMELYINGKTITLSEARQHLLRLVEAPRHAGQG